MAPAHFARALRFRAARSGAPVGITLADLCRSVQVPVASKMTQPAGILRWRGTLSHYSVHFQKNFA